MNTFWLKLTAAAVGIVVIIVLIGTFTSHGSNQPQPKQPEKTFYDQADQDKEKYLAEPKPAETQQQTANVQQPAVNNAQTAPAQPAQAPTKLAAPAQPAQTPAEQTKPTILYFKKLSEIDDIEAQRLLNVAVPGRSIGRLPMTGFTLMVPNCRQIIERWPDSWYAYRAKQMLGDLPERYKMRYKVTKEEMDLSMYYKQRPGTEPFTMEGTR
jgi:type IV secretory pathway VirB10-like protein